MGINTCALKQILPKAGDSPVKIQGFEKAWISKGLSPFYFTPSLLRHYILLFPQHKE